MFGRLPDVLPKASQWPEVELRLISPLAAFGIRARPAGHERWGRKKKLLFRPRLDRMCQTDHKDGKYLAQANCVGGAGEANSLVSLTKNLCCSNSTQTVKRSQSLSITNVTRLAAN